MWLLEMIVPSPQMAMFLRKWSVDGMFLLSFSDMFFPNSTFFSVFLNGPNLQFPQGIICFAIDEIQQIFDAARFRALRAGSRWKNADDPPN